ncbi:hypothetical protein KSF78_0008791 [Schistosoma japonicum]|nr:hypothetical protein KSF78_0008791 [Schistosoma japonicum]
MQDTALYSISLLLLFIQASIQTDNTLGWKLQGMEEVITEVEGTHNIISWAINDIKTQIGKRE